MAWGRRYSVAFTAASNTTHTIPVPRNLVYGDVLVVALQFNADTTLNAIPAGYTRMYPATATTSSSLWVYYALSNGTETSHTITIANARLLSGVTTAFFGLNPKTLASVVGTTITSTAIALPRIVNDGANALILNVAGAPLVSTAWTVSGTGATVVNTATQSGGPSLAVVTVNHSSTTGAQSNLVTANAGATTSLIAMSATFDSNALDQAYLGRFTETADPASGVISTGNIRYYVPGLSTGNRWVCALGGRFGYSSAAGTAQLGMYTALAGTPPGSPQQRLGVSKVIQVTDALASGASVVNFETGITSNDLLTGATAIPLATDTTISLGLVAINQGLRFGMIASGSLSTSLNRQFYSEAGTSFPVTANGASSTQGHMSLWAQTETNVPPLTPAVGAGRVFSPAPGAIVATLTPTFQVSFDDLNGAYGDVTGDGVNRGDRLTAYNIEVRAQGTASVIWSETSSPTAAEVTANQVTRVYSGPALANNATYEWRIRVADYFTYSEWSAWSAFTPQISGTITSVSPVAYTVPGTQAAITPSFSATWTHPGNLTLDSFQLQLSQNSSFDGAISSTWTSDPVSLLSVDSGDTFTVTWSNLTLRTSANVVFASTLTTNTVYYYRWRGTDSSGFQMPAWSATQSFKTNAAPNLPTNVTMTVDGVTYTDTEPRAFVTSASITFAVSDSDDTSQTGLIGRIRFINGSKQIIVSSTINAQTGLVTVPVTAIVLSTLGYGTWTCSIFAHDGELHSNGSTNNSILSSVVRTLVYSQLGALTNLSVTTYDPLARNQVALAVPFTATWTHPLGVAMVRYRPRLFLDINGVRQTSQVQHFSDGIDITYPSGTTFTGSAILGSLFFPNYDTYYWFQTSVTDANGLVWFSDYIRVKIDNPPAIPVVVGPTSGTVTTSLPTWSLTIADSDDAPGSVQGRIMVTRPDGTLADASGQVASYNPDTQRYEAVALASQFTQYGTYTWRATAYDGKAYSIDPAVTYSPTNLHTLANAGYTASRTLIYTAPGVITDFTPVAYTVNNQVNLTPTFAGTWSAPAGHALTRLEVQLSVTTTFTVPAFTGSYTFATPVASAGTFSATWAQLATGGNLTPNTTYYYRMRGIDVLGVSGDWTATRAIKSEAGPSVPVPVTPLGATVSTPPVLEVTIADSDTPVTGLTAIFQVIKPSGTVIANLTGYLADAATRTFRYQTTAAQVDTPGEYRWSATAFDGVLYAGNTPTAALAQYATQATFRYSAVGVLTPGALPYPVAGVSVSGPLPIFNATWTSGANRNLRSVTVEIYASNGVTLQASQTRSTYDVATGQALTYLWNGAALAGGTYQYRMQGVDQDGLATAWTAKTSFNVNRAPLTPVLAGAASKPVTNGTFDTTLDSWTFIPLSGVTATLTRSAATDPDAVSRGGVAQNTLKFAVTANTRTASAYVEIKNTTKIDCVGGRDYVLRASTYTTDNTLRPRLRVIWYDSNNAIISTATDPTRTSMTPNMWGTTWYDEAASFVAPATATGVQVGVEAYFTTGGVTGTLYVDNVTLQELPNNLAAAATVPNAAMTGSITGWSTGTYANVTSTLTYDPDIFRSAAGSLRWTRVTSTLAAGNLTPYVWSTTRLAVVPGRTLLFRAALRTSNPNLRPVLAFRWLDGAGAFTTATIQTPATYVANEWTDQAFTATVPAGITYLEPAFYLNPATANATGTAWIDDVSVGETMTVVTPTLVAAFQDQDGAYLNNYGDYVASGTVELLTTIDNLEYTIARSTTITSAADRAANTFSYVIPTDWLTPTDWHRLRLVLTDSQGAVSPAIDSLFQWAPVVGSLGVKVLRARAVVAAPVEHDLAATCAPLVPTILTEIQLRRADAYIKESSQRAEELTAMALIQSPDVIVADAFVVRPGETGRLIKAPGSSGWRALDGWYVSDAELSNGDVFTGANYVVPFGFTPSASYPVTAIGIAFASNVPGDGSLPDGGGVLTVRLQRARDGAWTTLASVAVTTAQLRQSGKITEYGQTATWLMLPVTGVTLEEGDRCAIAVSQEGLGPNLLTTANTAGLDGITGNVLNCLLATGLRPNAIDIRPWLLPNWLINGVQQRTELRLTDAPDDPLDMLITSVDCPVIFDEQHSVTLTIGALAIINGGLQMQPAADNMHELRLGSGAGLILNSVIRMRGNPKTRYAKLATAISVTTSTLTLDRPLIGWELGDELYIQDGLRGARKTRVRVAGVTNRTVTLQTPLTMPAPAGSYVVNLSRDARIRSLNQDANIAIFDNASLDWQWAALIDFAGNPVINPGPYSLVNWQNVVIETGANSYAGLDLDHTHLIENLTIVADEITSAVANYAPVVALRTNGPWAHAGELMLIDSGAIVPSISFTGHVIVIDPHFANPEATFMLGSDAVLTARITAPYFPAASTVISCNESNIQQITLVDSDIQGLSGGLGVIAVAAESVLYALDIINSRTNWPWVYLAPGAVVANAAINGSQTAASALVTSDHPALIQISDPMNPNAPTTIMRSDGTFWDGEGLASISRISTKFDRRTADGVTAIDAAIAGGSGSARYFAALPGATFREELSRHPVTENETLFLRVTVLGSGTLTLSMASSLTTRPTVTSTQNFTAVNSWSIMEIEITSNQSGVAVLSVSTTSECWVDQIQRIL